MQVKKKNKIKYGRTGISLNGKYATIIPTDEAIEIHTTPTSLIILSLWVFGFLGFLSTLAIDNIFVTAAIVVLGGVIGYLLVTKLYVGKVKEKFLYKDILALIPGSPELTIITTDNNMSYIRSLPKKQQNIIADINTVVAHSFDTEMLYEGGRFHFKIGGVYTEDLYKKEQAEKNLEESKTVEENK